MLSVRVLVVHPGTQHAPRLATELEKLGLLWRFWTGIAVAKVAWVEGKKRVVDIPKEKLRTIPWVEILALGLTRLPIRREWVWYWRNWFFQKLIPQSEIEAADVVIGFDTASWVIGERAKRAGKKFVLDQSVGHPLSRAREVLAAGGTQETWPEAFIQRPARIQAAEAKEHYLADVVAVGSSFAKKTLVENGVEEGKIRVLPYGVAEDFLQVGAEKLERWRREMNKESKGSGANGGRIRFLYAGYLTRRKGVGFLMKAWEKMEQKDVELRLAGGGKWDGIVPENIVLLGQISRRDMLREMMEADVFVFPSLFEGLGLVLLEAMAAGLAVITTPNTGGPDLIESGSEGEIVSAGDAKALRKAMEKLRSNPMLVREMGAAAHERAKEFTWGRWGRGYAEIIAEL